MRRVNQRFVGPRLRTVLAIVAPLAGLIWTAGCGDDDDGDGNDAGAAGMNAGRAGASGSGGASGSAGRAGSAGTGGGSSGSSGSAGEGASGSGGVDGSAGESSEAGSGGTGEGGAGGGSGCAVTPIGIYDGADFYTNTSGTTPIQTLVNGWSALVNAANMPSPGLMNVAERPITTTPAPTPPTAADMSAAFAAGTPSLSAVAPEPFRTLAGNLFTEHAQASLATWDGTPEQWDFASAPAGQGGVWHQTSAGTSARLFNERGVETRTLFALGSYAAVFYSYAQSVLADEITPATVDVVARAFGVDNPVMPIAPMVVPSGTYARTANYAHSIGLMAPIKSALIEAQAYAADESCAAERDAAIAAVLRGWERASMGRVVLYTHRAIGLASLPQNDFDKHSALHQLAEAASLAAGWRSISGKLISEAELDALLAELQHDGLPALGAVDAFALVGSDSDALDAALDGLEAAIARIRRVYGFSDAEIANFRAAMPVPG